MFRAADHHMLTAEQARRGQEVRMRWQRLVAVLVLVATAGVAVASSAAGKEVPDKGPFAQVPRLGGARPPSFVGVDSAGRLVGVSLVGEGQLVAYVCDGVDTGGWFKGSYDEGDTSATLKGKNGASLTLDLSSDPLTGTVTIDGEDATFRLAPASGSAGLYREKHGTETSGWVVDNDGAIYGITADESGKVVSSVAEGTPSSNLPSESAGSPDDPVPTAGFVGCAIAQLRLEREYRKLARGGSSAGSAVQAEEARNAACNPS
jgi:hypothetical protein